MTTYLLATHSVHVTAAAADYLQDRLDPATDDVVVVGVSETPDDAPIDGGTTDEPTDREAAAGNPPDRRPTDRAARPDRDAADAANVARSRLATVAPTIDLREGDPLAELEAAVDEHDPDVLVIGSHAGSATSSALGSTAQALLTHLDRPIVVVDPTP